MNTRANQVSQRQADYLVWSGRWRFLHIEGNIINLAIASATAGGGDTLIWIRRNSFEVAYVWVRNLYVSVISSLCGTIVTILLIRTTALRLIRPLLRWHDDDEVPTSSHYY